MLLAEVEAISEEKTAERGTVIHKLILLEPENQDFKAQLETLRKHGISPARHVALAVIGYNNGWYKRYL